MGLTDPRSFLLFIFSVLALLEYMDYIKSREQWIVISDLMSSVAEERDKRQTNEQLTIQLLTELLKYQFEPDRNTTNRNPR